METERKGRRVAQFFLRIVEKTWICRFGCTHSVAAALGIAPTRVASYNRTAHAARALAIELLGKNPTVLRAAKQAVRAVQGMSWELSDDYLMAKSMQSRFLDTEKGREKGLKQFLDEKSFRPGLGGYKRDA